MNNSNDVKTLHNLVIKGYAFQVVGYYEYRFKKNSVMDFSLRLLDERGYSGRSKIKISDMRKIADELIADKMESDKRTVYYKRFSGMTLTEVMSHVDFRYGRIIVSENLGNYVNIYCEDKYSPTGVSLVLGCTEAEFDIAGKVTNNSHNYVVGNEGRRIVNR